MTQLGRPSAILATLREARCALCGEWIRAPLYRFHLETWHPTAESPAPEAVRDMPIPLRIAEYVEAGNYLDDAAAACGIPRRTVTRWMEIGKALEEEFEPEEAAEIPAPRRIYWHFWRSVTLARDAAHVQYESEVRRAGRKDWKALAFLMERTAPEKFGRTDRVRIGGDPDAGPVRVVHEEADPDFIADVMRIYEDQGVIPGVPSTNGRNGKSRRPKKEA